MIFNKIFSALFKTFQLHKWLIVICIIVAIILSAVRIYHLEFKNDVSAMLPNNAEVAQYFTVLRNSNISEKIIISFYLNSDKHSLDELLKNVDKFADSLNSPLISKIETGFPSNSFLSDLKNIIKLAPQIINNKELNKITAEHVNISLKNDYKKLLSPGINFYIDLIRLDPLNIYSHIFKSLDQLSSFMNYKILPLKNHFISYDMKHAMIILQTPVPVTDSGKSKLLINYLNKKLHKLPNYILPNIISGHQHAISNEQIIKNDVSKILIISTIAFLLLFIFVLKKDFKCLLLFMLPVISAFLAMALSSYFISELAYFIIGMGGVITGISIDYGIHAYIAVNTVNNIDQVKKVAKPIIVGGLTTIGIFASFFFSDVTGYHQLAVFAIFSITISIIFALLLLPQFLKNTKHIDINLPRYPKLKEKHIPPVLIIACWLCAIFILTFFAFQQSIDNNIKKLNGSDNSIVKNEDDFHRIWGGSTMPAILVTNSNNRTQLFEDNDKLYRKITKAIGQNRYYNLVSVWPSQKKIINNISNWNRFWNKNREKVKKLIIEYSPKYNFAPGAFKPFFNSIKSNYKLTNKIGENQIFEKLSKQFLYERNGRFYMLSYLPDKKTVLEKVKKIIINVPNTFLLSKKNFAAMLSDSVSSEIIYLAAIAAVIIPLLSLLLLRNIAQTILSLLPVISSVIAICGFLYLIKIKINAPIIIASLITVGLSIDYGIFMVYHSIFNLKSGTRLATSLSALTTLIGAVAVSFAKHPLLFNIGITLIVGVSTGYLVSFFVIPAIIDSLPKLKNRKNSILFSFVFLIFSCFILLGCRSAIPFKKPDLTPINNINTKTVLADFKNKLPNKFTIVSSIVFNYRWHSFSCIAVSKIDLKDNSIIVVGLNQMGIKLFEIESSKGKITNKFLMEDFKKYRNFPKTIIKDINRIYFNNIPESTSDIKLKKYRINFINSYGNGKLYYTFGGKSFNLLNKIYIKNNRELWNVSFYEYTLIDNKLYPRGIIYNNTESNYQLVIRLKDAE